MIDLTKIPFAQDTKFVYDSLMKNFTFKYAILQNEEIMGILYLEIPFKYKFTKKFKIDDWFAVKPFDKAHSRSFDNTLVARVVVTYDANAKLDPKDYDHLEELQELPQSPKADFKAKMRKIKQMTAAQDNKENVNYLEEVERNILNRRKPGSSADKSLESNRLLRSSSKTLVRPRGVLTRTSTNKKLPQGTSVTPDQMYRTAGNEPGKVGEDKLLTRMTSELGKNRQEIKELRDKLKHLEEGQMTVDNLELSRKLDEEKGAINLERTTLLKDYASKTDELDRDRKKFQADKSKAEEDLIKKKNELEEKAKEIEIDRIQIRAKEDGLKDRLALIDIRENKLASLEDQLKAQKADFEKERLEVHEYQNELNDLKEKLLKERDKLMNEKTKFVVEKEDLERDIKTLKSVKENLEKEKEREMKDINRRRKDLELSEEKVARESERLKGEEERLKKDRARCDEETKRFKQLNDELEEEKLKVWRDRNSLNNEVKNFIDDRKKMENELKWRQKELDNHEEEIQKEFAQLEEDKGELELLEQMLDSQKVDLETREQMLLTERDDFNNLKQKFIEGIMESGGLDHLTPEIKQMAKAMGIDLYEMEKEKAKIEARRKELQKLQKQHEDELALIKQKVNSKGASRRSSISQRRGSVTGGLKAPGAPGSRGVGHKMAVESYLQDLYDEATNKFLAKQLKEAREKMDKLLEEKNIAQQIIDNLRNDNKALKREFDIVAKIIEQYKAGGMKLDLDSLLGRNKPIHVATSTERDQTFDEERTALEKRVRELEGRVRRGSVGGQTLSDLDNDDEFNAKLREITEQLKKLLGQIEREQTEYHDRGLPEIGNRIKNIHFLVYNFIQDIIQFLIRFHKPRDKAEREVFSRMLDGLGIAGPIDPRTSRLGEGGGNLGAGDADLLSRVQARNKDLEGRVQSLLDLLESMKSTFEFFEVVNDQYVMQKPV